MPGAEDATSTGSHKRDGAGKVNRSIGGHSLSSNLRVASLDVEGDEKVLVEFDDAPEPPDGGWGWVVCFACFMGQFCIGGLVFTFGVLIKPLAMHFGAPYSKVSLVGSVILGIGYGLGPISSLLVSKFGSRMVCMGGGLVTMAGVGLSVLSPNLSVMFALYGVTSGVGIGLMFLPTGIFCSYYFKKKRAIANGLSYSGSCAGGIVVAPVMNYLVEHYGWQVTVLSAAGLMGLIVLEGSLLRPLELTLTAKGKEQLRMSSNPPGLSASSESAENFSGGYVSTDASGVVLQPSNDWDSQSIVNPLETADSFLEKDPTEYLKNLPQDNTESVSETRDVSCFQRFQTWTVFEWMRKPLFILMVINAALAQMGCYLPLAYLPELVTSIPQEHQDGSHHYITSGEAALLLSLVNAGNLIGRIMMGAIVDLPWLNPVVAYICALFASSVFMVGFIVVTDFKAFAICSVLYGLAVAGPSSQMNLVLTELFGLESLSATFGIMCFFRGVFFFLSWPLAAFVFESFESRPAMFMLGAAQLATAGVVGCLMMVFSRKPK